MATQKQRRAARKNVKKAQAGARRKKTITKLSKKTAQRSDGKAPRRRRASEGPPKAREAAPER